MSARVRPSGDSGSVLPLIFGFAAIGALLLAVVVTVSSVFLAQRRLDAAADGAATAAANELNDGVYYSRAGKVVALPLDREAATAAVERYLDDAPLRQWLEDLDAPVVALDSAGTTVTVTLNATLDLPFAGLFFAADGGYPISATASARSPVRAARLSTASSGSE